MSFYSDDPVKDADRYIDYQDSMLEELPICTECEEPIQEMECYVIGDRIICEHCIDNFKEFTENVWR